ncbi:DUF418 domain-containing protein [Vogesella fluminis]|uniref:Transporter n=1 Tax=Vogesella fluminis TaxID=1069161 RepID=A0ABQ3H9S9_9NEIS|nr:heparan-alpha-glucosaminide N-acetyltransferase domain-containing protein [Vogesella fluminis]GHD75789.1 transporter [Vogesella fluminis]
MRNTTARLEGLDLARCLALIGMVLVNFRIAMGVEQGGPDWLQLAFDALHGRAAATFVVLAGIGLGLATRHLDWWAAQRQTVRRAAFLLVAGLLNVMLFPADIIHYYAVYFVLGALCLRLPGYALWGLIAALATGFIALLFMLDYDRGWHWADYSYPDFWLPAGFLRNLLFNGWHPVLPWLGFVLYGLWLSRQPLAETRVQRYLVLGGVLAVLAGHALSWALRTLWPQPALAPLFGVMPVPPVPLYLVAGGGVASMVIGAALWLAQRWPQGALLAWLAPAGRQTLTLYIAHILLGMGVMEATGWLQGRSLAQVLLAAALYCLAALLFARLWSRRFARGPLEALMRRCCG